MRIILDTNVIFSGLRMRSGVSAALVAMVGTGRFELVMSVALALEYEAVLKRDNVGGAISPDDADDLVAFLCINSERHELGVFLRPLLTDPNDEFLAELAVSSACDYLVTHNISHFEPLAARGIRVVTPGQLLSIIEQEQKR